MGKMENIFQKVKMTPERETEIYKLLGRGAAL